MAEGFSSGLDSPQDRFLSLSLQYSLKENWLRPEDLFVEFPPEVIMKALEAAEGLRSKILVEAAGVHEKIAPKKSSAAAAEDLRLALDEKVCTPTDLLRLFGADDQVRHLDGPHLWSFLSRDKFYQQGGNRERDRMLFLLQTALDERLIDLATLVNRIGAEKIAEALPKKTLEKVFVEAVTVGLTAGPFDAEALITAVPLSEWVEHLPLAHLWESAVGEVAAEARFVHAAQAKGELPKQTGAGKQSDPKKAEAKKAETKKATPQKSGAADDAEEAEVEDVEVEVLDGPTHPSAPELSVAPASDRSREEVVARDRALQNLKNLGREPRDPASLSTPLLLAIDAMYAELVTLSDDESRAECIREAFPSEKLLLEGLYALVESLDPKLDAKDLQQKDAGLESLIQLVLFEERRRDSGLPSRGSSPPPLVPPPPSELGGRSVPPPPLPPPPPPPPPPKG